MRPRTCHPARRVFVGDGCDRAVRVARLPRSRFRPPAHAPRCEHNRLGGQPARIALANPLRQQLWTMFVNAESWDAAKAAPHQPSNEEVAAAA